MRMPPRVPAGIFGMLLAAGLYIAHALRADAGGLSPIWLVVLFLPGALAAHLSFRRGMQSAWGREGALAGVLAAHFASTLQVAVFAVAVWSTDWAAYAQQVGPQVAGMVREAALPAALVVAAALVAVTYISCALAGWLGALAYAIPARRLGAQAAGPGKGAAPDWEG